MDDEISPHDFPYASGLRLDQSPPPQMGWRVPINPHPPQDWLGDGAVDAINGAVLRLLQDVGIEIAGAASSGDPVLAAFRAAGARVEGNQVRIDEDLLLTLLSHAPDSFTLTPRNPERTLQIGGRHMVFSAVASAIDTWDLQRGRRAGDFASCQNLLRLAQSFDCIHMLGGYPVEPMDIPAPVRHLDCTFAALTLTDKVINAYPLSREVFSDTLMLAQLASGLDEEEFLSRPRLYMNINSSSLLLHEARVLDCAMAAAEAGQAVFVTPYVVADAATPGGMAPAVVQALAEGLAAIALLQAVRPGTPVVLGALTTHAAPQNGAPVFGSPDSLRATQMIGQMARHHGLPFRATNACSANIPDGQAMAESASSIWCAVNSGANVLYHAAGWLSGGYAASAEKFVMDCELLQMVQRYFEAAPQPATPEELIAGVLRKGEGARDSFYTPVVSDWRSYEQWQESGAVWTSERAGSIARALLENYVPPPLDPARQEAMRDFLRGRRLDLGHPAED